MRITFWSVANTTSGYGKNMPSYSEDYFLATGKTMSVCLWVNELTDSDPFVSALELVVLWDSAYNTTDFEQHGLRLVHSSSFGYNGATIRYSLKEFDRIFCPSLAAILIKNVGRYPDDPFDRFWESHMQNGVRQTSVKNVPVSEFWNLPPPKVIDQELIIPVLEQMDLPRPTSVLDGQSNCYIDLSLAVDQDSLAGHGPRVLNITVNGIPYYSNPTVSSAGVVVFSSKWPLTGQTKLKLDPAPGSESAPFLNAGEVR